MFISIVNFPPVKEGQDGQFREWFTWSNEEFAKHKGFIRRRLLRPVKDGAYMAIVEFESHEVFKAIQGSPVHDEAGKRVMPLLDGFPTPEFYEVVIDGP